MLSKTTYPHATMISYPHATKTSSAGKISLQTLFFFLLVTQICFAQLEFFNGEQQTKNSLLEQLHRCFVV